MPSPQLCQEIWQCFSLQLTFTSPPSQVCLEFTFALLCRADAFTLRLISVRRYGIVFLHNLPSHHLHQVCLDFTIAMLFIANAFTLRLISVKKYGSVSLHSFPSRRLHHKFVVSLPSHCFSQQTPSRCALLCQEIWQCFSLQLTFTSPPS